MIPSRERRVRNPIRPFDPSFYTKQTPIQLIGLVGGGIVALTYWGFVLARVLEKSNTPWAMFSEQSWLNQFGSVVVMVLGGVLLALIVLKCFDTVDATLTDRTRQELTAWLSGKSRTLSAEKASTPVVSATLLFHILMNQPDGDAILGDLLERFKQTVPKCGILQANGWYWHQVVIFLRLLVWAWLMRIAGLDALVELIRRIGS